MSKKQGTAISVFLPIHYDRCLPSVLAFHDAASAQSFASEHGGEVMGWAGALAKLREKKP